MKAIVTKKWGTYKKGDVLDLPESTVKAIAKHGYLSLPSNKKPTKKEN